jgi:hypothetical protein
MTRDQVNKEYFNWMCFLACPDNPEYYGLLEQLHATDFEYSLDMDGNRAEDGMELRYRFGEEYSYGMPVIAAYLDDRPCSVLEMMLALAIRCEEHIMDNPDMGDRTSCWFGEMIDNLGLYGMHGPNYDSEYVDHVLYIFLNREYERNGEGGLFTIRDPKRDMRTTDIWYQMCWYINENYWRYA